MYEFATIVLIPFPFTDLSSSKVRPAMIVSNSNEDSTDVIVAFITSKIPKEKAKTHYQLKGNEKDFESTGLKVDSTFRFDKLATLDKRLILGELGEVNKSLQKKMKPHFLSSFGFS
jgi:mRNA interferase MazF